MALHRCPQCGYVGEMQSVPEEQGQNVTNDPWLQARQAGQQWQRTRGAQSRAFRTYGPMGYQAIFGSPYEPESAAVAAPQPVQRTRSRWGFEY